MFPRFPAFWIVFDRMGGSRMKDETLHMMLFAHEPAVVLDGMAAGIRNFMVDCEWRGKVQRQRGADTDTSHASLERLAEAVAVPGSTVNCRINSYGAWTDGEIDAAVEHGAHRIFLPMIRHMREAERFLRRVDGRTLPAILIETDEAVRIATDLATLPFDAVYVGLNDLAISRGSQVIFEAVLDGTVEHVRSSFEHVSFGFGGVTLLGHGYPLPVELLLAEMHRLQCNFSFLRRSYFRDVTGRNAAKEIAELHDFWRELGTVDDVTRVRRKRELDGLIRQSISKSATPREGDR